MSKFSLKAIEDRLRCVHQLRETKLIEQVRRSGLLSTHEIDEHLSIVDYRPIILEFGKVLLLPGLAIEVGFALASALHHIKGWIHIATNIIWKAIGVRITLVLLSWFELAIGCNALIHTIRCSREWMWFTGTVAHLSQYIFTALSNWLFSMLLDVMTEPIVVRLFRFLQREAWPLLHQLLDVVYRSISILWLTLSSLVVGRPTLLTYLKLVLILEDHYQRHLTKSDTGSILADAILGRPIERLAQHGNSAHTELWVDVFPEADLFDTKESSPLMALWQQIDECNTLDQQLFEQVKATFTECSQSDIRHAIRHLARSPRPVLSSVLVATGFKTGLAAEFAASNFPHLNAETSRWHFFAQMKPALLPSPALPRTIFLVSVAEFHRRRVLAAKHYARILELILIDEENDYEFVFAFPVCRPRSPSADSRDLFVAEFRQSLVNRYLPPNVTITLLDDLYTEIELPNIKGLSYILALQKLCAGRDSQEFIVLSEFNDSASWLNVFQLYRKLPHSTQAPCLISGCRPFYGAGKLQEGHLATQLFNALFRLWIPIVQAKDSSAVIKLATVRSLRAVCQDLSCLDYAIDQDILAMMSLRGVVYEVPIQWFQTLGPHGHERNRNLINNQILSLRDLARKVVRERRLAALKPDESLPLDAGFDFQAYLDAEHRIVKGFLPRQNRLLLFISAMRSMSRKGEAHEGHQQYSALVPVATALIGLLGQGPLKSLLHVLEGRYRDPLPQIEEQLKREVPQIVESQLSYFPQINTVRGKARHTFALTQPFASLGTLESALKWNLRYSRREGVIDTLDSILRLQSELFRHGSFDPDMKSLFDCGLFLEAEGVTLKYLDFAGFTCDPYVVKLLLPTTLRRIISLKDFRYIARCLAGSTNNREIMFNFKHKLATLYTEMGTRGDWSHDIRYCLETPTVDVGKREPLPQRAMLDQLATQVMAKAKFRSHAPLADFTHQYALRSLVDRGYSKLLVPQSCHITLSSTALSCHRLTGSPHNEIEIILLVKSAEIGNALENALAIHMPEIQTEVRVLENAKAFQPLNILCDATSRSSKVKILVPMAGGSTRMERLVIGSKLPHKGLLPVLGKPLIVHALATQAIPLARIHPDMSWIVIPDTIVLWNPPPIGYKNPAQELAVPFPPVAMKPIRVAECWTQGRFKELEKSNETMGVGALLLRSFLVEKSNGYSLPSILGVKPNLLSNVNRDLNAGDQGVSDFWEYCAASLHITDLYDRGSVAHLTPLLWFDIDTPALLKTFYDALVSPLGDIYRSYFPMLENLSGTDTAIATENTVSVESSLTVAPEAAGKLLFKRCFFDHAEVNLEVDPQLHQVVLEGLVVVNSRITLKVAAPIIRDVFVYGIDDDFNRELTLDLDNQLYTIGKDGCLSASPLMLSDLALNGYHELLRCPVRSGSESLHSITGSNPDYP